MSASEVAVTSTPRLEVTEKSVVVKVEDRQIRHQDKTSSSTSTSPKWTTKSSDPAKDRSSRAASEAAEVETAGQTASSENCYNHYARNLLLVHK